MCKKAKLNFVHIDKICQSSVTFSVFDDIYYGKAMQYYYTIFDILTVIVYNNSEQ